MRELLPVISDDLDWTDKGLRTPATKQRVVGWDGHWYLLDLNDEHDAELAETMARYVRAGQHQDSPPKPGQRPKGTGRGAWADYVAQKQKVVEWAQAHELRVTRRKEGGWYVPVKTQRAYDEAHPEEARERAARSAAARVTPAPPGSVPAAPGGQAALPSAGDQ